MKLYSNMTHLLERSQVVCQGQQTKIYIYVNEIDNLCDTCHIPTVIFNWGEHYQRVWRYCLVNKSINLSKMPPWYDAFPKKYYPKSTQIGTWNKYTLLYIFKNSKSKMKLYSAKSPNFVLPHLFGIICLELSV